MNTGITTTGLYFIEYNRIDSHGVVDWCLDNFGIDSKETWQYNIFLNTFYFAKKEDAALFIVRWS